MKKTLVALLFLLLPAFVGASVYDGPHSPIVNAISDVAHAQPCVAAPCVVVAGIGQSNEAGGNARWKNATDVGPAGTYMYNPIGGAIAALAEQTFNIAGTGGNVQMGSRVNFIKISKSTLWPNSDVILVPAAVGSIGFTQPGGTMDPVGWGVGGTAYENFITYMTTVLALNPANSCGAIFTGMGEADGLYNISIPTFINYFTTMAADLRTRLPKCANTPIFIRGMSPAYAAVPGATNGLKSSQAAQMILGTNYVSSKFFFVSSQYPDLPYNYAPDQAQSLDTVHFSGIAQRQLAGREFFEFVTKYLCQPWPFGNMK